MGNRAGGCRAAYLQAAVPGGQHAAVGGPREPGQVLSVRVEVLQGETFVDMATCPRKAQTARPETEPQPPSPSRLGRSFKMGHSLPSTQHEVGAHPQQLPVPAHEDAHVVLAVAPFSHSHMAAVLREGDS